jgi:hypothetical protein
MAASLDGFLIDPFAGRVNLVAVSANSAGLGRPRPPKYRALAAFVTL